VEYYNLNSTFLTHERIITQFFNHITKPAFAHVLSSTRFH